MFDNNLIDKQKRLIEILKNDNNFDDNISKLNRFSKTFLNIWFFIDPVSGSVGKGMELFAKLFDDLVNDLEGAKQEEINQIFNDILNQYSEKTNDLEKKVKDLTPKASIVYKQNNFEIMKGRGISSVTDISNYEFEINFVENLRNPEDYLALTNITGVQTNVTNTKINIQLPQNFDYNSNIPIQVGLIKIYFWKLNLDPIKKMVYKAFLQFITEISSSFLKKHRNTKFVSY